MDDRPECAEIRELLPEVAVGVATDGDRARVAEHLGACTDCRHELDALVEVADGLIELAPSAEPPAGFADAVVRKATRHAATRWRRPVAAAAAVLAALGIGAGAVTWRTADDRRLAEGYRRTLRVADGTYFTARPFTTPYGPTDARLFAYKGNPSWLFVVMEHSPVAGGVAVHVVMNDGADHLVGSFETAAGGPASWGATVDVDLAKVAQVRLVAPVGPVLTAVYR